jgi:hypothetical protein
MLLNLSKLHQNKNISLGFLRGSLCNKFKRKILKTIVQSNILTSDKREAKNLINFKPVFKISGAFFYT